MSPRSPEARARLRLRSLGWALLAGLVGAVCGIHSLALPLEWNGPAAEVLPGLMMALLRAWLPLIGAALVLHAGQRSLSVLRP
ncbi:hypothetical protein [Cyanobium sp. ATX-6F1]|uniref:hypothetical protein n=1 Tax=Cyanobium sp. ATX-6F1 TaxID=3137388 RepID=UPI0039BDD48E